MKKGFYNALKVTVLSTAIFSIASISTAFAGAWKHDANGWWYENGDGTYITNKWEWIDSNGDGLAECYYFYDNGYMASDTVVDGYIVNANGAWTDGAGNVQTKSLNVQSSGSTSTNSQKTLQELYQENFTNGTFIDYSNGASAGGVSTGFIGSSSSSTDNNEEVKSLEEYSNSELYKMITGSYSSANDPTKGYSNDEAIDAVVYLVNILRSKKGLNEVTADNTLMEAAQVRAEEATEKFSHTRPDGSDCFTALDEAGWPQDTHAAENLAQGQKTALQVVNAWYHSSGHKHNMLHEKNGTIGVGISGSGYSMTWSQFFSE